MRFSGWMLQDPKDKKSDLSQFGFLLALVIVIVLACIISFFTELANKQNQRAVTTKTQHAKNSGSLDRVKEVDSKGR